VGRGVLFIVAKKLAKDNDSKVTVENIERYYKEIPAVKDEIQDILINTNSNCLQKFFKNSARTKNACHLNS